MAKLQQVEIETPLERALDLMRTALALVDMGCAPADIGALLDEAVARLSGHLDQPEPVTVIN